VSDQPPRRRRHVSVPKSGHPLVLTLLREIRNRELDAGSVMKRSGVGREAIFRWRCGTSTPSITNFDAVLNVLGLELAIVPKKAQDE
jgi:hypothetical protein